MSTLSNIFDESPLEEEEEGTPLVDEESSTNSTRVLLVDADSNSLLRMQNLMTKSSYQVTTCYNGEEAINFLKKNKHEIDLVIWDFHMPKINLLDALNFITKEINLPVVIISNDNKKEMVMKSITCGACDFLLKPLSQEVISVLWRHIYREKNSGLVKPEELIKDEPEIDESDHSDQLSYEENKSKKPRLTWTPQLHRDFEVAYKVQHRESKAFPMEILKYMKEVLHVTHRLTRSHVASHLQKYRQNLSKKIRTDSELEEILDEDVGSRNDGPNTGPTFWASPGLTCGPSNGPTFWASPGLTCGPSNGPNAASTSSANAGASSAPRPITFWATTGPSSMPAAGPNIRPSAGPNIRPSAGPSYRPISGPNIRPSAGPSFRPISVPNTRPVTGPIYGPCVHGASNLFVNSNVNLYEGGRYVMNDRAILNAPVQYAASSYQPMFNDPVITNSLHEQLQQQQYNLQLPNTMQAQQEPPRVLENPVQLIYNSPLPDNITECFQGINSHLNQTPQNG